MKGSYARLTGEKLYLEPLKSIDIEKLRVLRNRHNNKEVFIEHAIISQTEQAQWYERYFTKVDDIMFSIMSKNHEWLGAVALYNIDERRRTAEFGRLLLDKSRIVEKGLGAEATRLICEFGFKTFSLQEIILNVFASNLAAIKIYTKVGFKFVGEGQSSERGTMYQMRLSSEAFMLHRQELKA